MFKNFDERAENPRVLITYKSTCKSFTIAYRNKYDNIIYDHDCKSDLMEGKYKKIKDWLIQTDNKFLANT